MFARVDADQFPGGPVVEVVRLEAGFREGCGGAKARQGLDDQVRAGVAAEIEERVFRRARRR